jgi:hypothetical protein
MIKKMPSKPKLAFLLVSVFLVSYGSRILYDRWRLTTPYDPQIYLDLIARFKTLGYSFDGLGVKTVTVVHDVDSDMHGLYTLVRIENSSGIKSIFYIRPDSEYMTYVLNYLQYIESKGWSIGFHYDCLSRADGNEDLARRLFIAQVFYMRNFFNITTTRAHGDSYNPSINNLQLYRDWKILWDVRGLTDLTELQGNYTMISDSHHNLQIPDSFQDHILLLLHGDWW